MSTNKTQNYALHAWEPNDDFQLQELNANFSALDASARWFAGTYTGTGTTEKEHPTTLTLEPWVKLVIILGGSFTGIFLRDSAQAAAYNPNGEAAYLKAAWTDDALSWYASTHYTSSGGYYVSVSAAAQLNQSGTVYHYIALG